MNKKNVLAEKKSNESMYSESLIANMPRILNQLDRNPNSSTFGCFDRDYWQYKIVDFPCARKQEAVLSLALLQRNKFSGNPYFASPTIKSWCEAAIGFWACAQNQDGSSNEWYPEEHSFVATAFSTYAITEAILVLMLSPSPAVLETINKAGVFLQNHTEFRVQNQQAGAIVALHNCSLITGSEAFALFAKERLAELAKHQTREGWFDEYGGPDVGYLSVAIDYLGKYYEKTNDKQALDMIKKAAGFLVHAVHPDGSVGGVYTSRSTEYLIPSAFEHDAGPDVELLAQVCRQGIQSAVLPSCSTLDDRYLLYNGYTYAQAALSEKKINKNICLLPQGSVFFSECGWFVRRTPRYFLVINTKKGGAFYFASPDNKVHDAGVFISGAPVLSSCFIGSSIEVELLPKIASKCQRIVIRGSMQASPEEVLSPFKNMLLRGTQLTVGKNTRVRNLLKEAFRDRLIAGKKDAPKSFVRDFLKTAFRAKSVSEGGLAIKFERVFVLSDDAVAVEDIVHNPPLAAEFIVGVKQPVQTVPSSRFFVPSDIESHAVISKSAVIHRKLL